MEAYKRQINAWPPQFELPSSHVPHITPVPLLSDADRARLVRADYSPGEIRALEARYLTDLVERAMTKGWPCASVLYDLEAARRDAAADEAALASLTQQMAQLVMAPEGGFTAPEPIELGHVPVGMLHMSVPVAMDEDGPIVAGTMMLPANDPWAIQNILLPVVQHVLLQSLVKTGVLGSSVAQPETLVLEWAFHTGHPTRSPTLFMRLTPRVTLEKTKRREEDLYIRPLMRAQDKAAAFLAKSEKQQARRTAAANTEVTPTVTDAMDTSL
jgi:hypothetical protein